MSLLAPSQLSTDDEPLKVLVRLLARQLAREVVNGCPSGSLDTPPGNKETPCND